MPCQLYKSLKFSVDNILFYPTKGCHPSVACFLALNFTGLGWDGFGGYSEKQDGCHEYFNDFFPQFLYRILDCMKVKYFKVLPPKSFFATNHMHTFIKLALSCLLFLEVYSQPIGNHDMV